jgi:hypothetical protein
MKHIIEDISVSYENIRILIDGKWIYISPEKLKGLEIEGDIVKKRTREWLI